MTDIDLACTCGSVRGTLREATPETVNRVLCYCDDCQAFHHHLGQASLLDDHGGSDIIQVAPSSVTWEKTEHISGVRLTEKGLHRWYASCCKAPLGNTLTPAVPFIGLAHSALKTNDLDAAIGAPRAKILGKWATNGIPAGSDKLDVRFLARVFRLLVGWKLRGRTWPNPFYDRASRKPVYALATLSPTERQGLRVAYEAARHV